MTPYKKVLVTGGAGVAGSGMKSIAFEYPEIEFVFASLKSADLTDLPATLAFIKDCAPDAIIHLAAKSGGIGLSMKYPATLLRDNVLMNMNVLEAARLNNVKKIIMTLSVSMYCPEAPHPLREDAIHVGTPHESAYSYAFAKRLVEPSIRAYKQEYGMNVIGLIPNGIFGPNDNFNFESAPMLPALIRRFYENKDNNLPLTIWGDGSPLREYTFSYDIARAFMWCLENYDEAQVLNVGSTEEHSVKEIAHFIADILNVDKGRIEFDTSRPKGVARRNTDNSRFVKLSNFKYTPFSEGLKKTIDWFVDAYQNPATTLRIHDKN